VDSAFLQFTVAQTLQRTASVHLLFAFEYVIQASIIVSTFCKYMLALVDRWYPSRPSLHGSHMCCHCMAMAPTRQASCASRWKRSEAGLSPEMHHSAACRCNAFTQRVCLPGPLLPRWRVHPACPQSRW